MEKLDIKLQIELNKNKAINRIYNQFNIDLAKLLKNICINVNNNDNKKEQLLSIEGNFSNETLFLRFKNGYEDNINLKQDVKADLIENIDDINTINENQISTIFNNAEDKWEENLHYYIKENKPIFSVAGFETFFNSNTNSNLEDLIIKKNEFSAYDKDLLKHLEQTN